MARYEVSAIFSLDADSEDEAVDQVSLLCSTAVSPYGDQITFEGIEGSGEL